MPQPCFHMNGVQESLRWGGGFYSPGSRRVPGRADLWWWWPSHRLHTSSWFPVTTLRKERQLQIQQCSITQLDSWSSKISDANDKTMNSVTCFQFANMINLVIMLFSTTQDNVTLRTTANTNYFSFGLYDKNCNDVGDVGRSNWHWDDELPPGGQEFRLENKESWYYSWLFQQLLSTPSLLVHSATLQHQEIRISRI